MNKELPSCSGCEHEYECVNLVCFYELLEKEKQKIRADAIEEFKQALHTQFVQNKALAKRCSRGDRVKELALTNIDLEEVDNIAEQLRSKQNDKD